MKFPILISILILMALSVGAQPKFTSADLPSRVGDWYRAYANTSGVAVATWVGPKGGPHRWDFSSAPSSADHLQRIDIVAASDEGHGTSLSGATYAERLSRTGSGPKSWSYYSVAPGQGRLYYGFYDPVSNAADPITKFDEPTLELPDMGFGSAWERAVTFEDTIDLGFTKVPVLIQFTAKASVDAWGSVILPDIGEVEALRVNEVNTYVTTDTALGFPLGTQHLRSYYWLVKGIGKAVHILSKPSASVPPEDFGASAYLLRVFESSAFPSKPPLEPVANLRATRKGQEIFVSWDQAAGATTYLVEFTPSLGPGASWSGLATNRESFLFDPIPLSAGQRFYRVFSVQNSGTQR